MSNNFELAEQAKTKGNQHFSKQEWEKAIEEYTKAIECNPNGNGAHTYFSNRSACFAEQQKYEEALDDAKQCIKLKPDFGKGYSRLGLAYFKLDNLGEAKKAYQQGLKIEPNNESLKNGLDEVAKAQKPTGLFGPEIWMTIHQDPELKQYANDKDFIAKVNMLQTNAQMAIQTGILGDPKIKKLFERLMGARFGGMSPDEKEDESGPHPPKSNNKPNDQQDNEESDEDEEDNENDKKQEQDVNMKDKEKEKGKPKETEKPKEKKRGRRNYL